jgi:hypothetical protein
LRAPPAEATTTARATSTDGLVVKVEVLTPEGQVFADEVELVSTRITTGSIGIKARHAPLMAILEPTQLRLYKSDSDVVRFPHTVTASSTYTLRTPASPGAPSRREALALAAELASWLAANVGGNGVRRGPFGIGERQAPHSRRGPRRNPLQDTHG